MNKKTKSKLNTRLKLIKKYLSTDPSKLRHNTGICYNVEVIKLPRQVFGMRELFEKYPNCSVRRNGTQNLTYPVGGENQYFKDKDTSTMWSNPKRIALLNWLIEETKP